MARKVIAGLLLVALAGCTAKAPPAEPSPSGPQRTAVVSADGFTVTDGTTTVDGPSGVTAPGTQATLTTVAAPKAPKGVKWAQAAPAFDIAFTSGAQPKVPVTVSLALSAADADRDGLTFITKSSATDTWEGLPVTRSGATAQVELGHFSNGFWAWTTSLGDSFDKAVNHYLKLRYDPPKCKDKALVADGRRYTATVSGNGIYVCVEAVDGKPTVTVRSNSPFVWTLTGPKGQVSTVQPTPPVEAAQIATIAAFDQIVGKLANRETVLVPGGNAGLAITGQRDFKVAAAVDAGLGLVAVLVAAVDETMAMTGASFTANEIRAVGECAAGVVQAGLAPDTGTVLRTVLDCFGTMVKGAAAVVVGLLTSLSSLLVTQLTGFVGSVTGTNYLTISVTNQADDAGGTSSGSPLVISMDGVGQAKVGMRMSQFAAALGGRLPDTGKDEGCNAAGFEAHGIRFGVLSDGAGSNGPVQSVTLSLDGQGAAARTVLTPKGIHLGSALRDVLATYPGAKVEADEVAYQYKDVTVFNADHSKAIVFIVDDHAVVHRIQAGMVPQAQYPEGCL